MADPLNVVRNEGRTPADPGYDHAWYEYEPIVERPRVTLPDDKHLAVAVLLDLTAPEWESDLAPMIPPVGGRGLAPSPDVPRLSHREYGHRAGVYRIVRELWERQVPITVVIDVLTVTHYPALMKYLEDVTTEFVAGGLSASRPITSRMSESEERHYISAVTHQLEAHLSTPMSGWLGPGHGESERTPALLAEAGYSYVCDWGNDEQPYPMHGAGSLWSYAVSWELSDVAAMEVRGVSAATYGRSLVEGCTVMAADGRLGPRSLGLHLSPWCAGQPYRIDPVLDAMESVRNDPWVLWTTPSQVVSWWRRQQVAEDQREGDR